MKVAGKVYYDRWKAGGRLTYRQAVFAKCYDCNGGRVSTCSTKNCPLYPMTPYKQRDLARIKTEINAL